MIVIQWSAVCLGSVPENIKLKGKCRDLPKDEIEKKTMLVKADRIKSKPKLTLKTLTTETQIGVTLDSLDIPSNVREPTVVRITTTIAPELQKSTTDFEIDLETDILDTTMTSKTEVTPVEITLQPVTTTPEPIEEEIERKQARINGIPPGPTMQIRPELKMKPVQKASASVTSDSAVNFGKCVNMTKLKDHALFNKAICCFAQLANKFYGWELAVALVQWL